MQINLRNQQRHNYFSRRGILNRENTEIVEVSSEEEDQPAPQREEPVGVEPPEQGEGHRGQGLELNNCTFLRRVVNFIRSFF